MNEKEERDVLGDSFMLGIVSGMAYLGMSQGFKWFEPSIYGLALTLASTLFGYFLLIYGEEVFPNATEIAKDKVKKRPVIKPKKLQPRPRPEIKPTELKIKPRPEINSLVKLDEKKPEVKDLVTKHKLQKRANNLEPKFKPRPIIKSDTLKPKERPVINKEIKPLELKTKPRPKIDKFEDYSVHEVKSRLEKRTENRRFKKHKE